MKTLYITLFFQLAILSKMQGQDMSISEKLIHSTVQIECEYLNKNNNYKSSGSGTAFILEFKHNHYSIPVLVTNKHVIKNAINGVLTFTKTDEFFNPSYGNNVQYKLDNFESRWIKHSNPNVDLCIMAFAPIEKYFKEQHTPIYYTSISEEFIPKDTEWDNFTALEEVIMIGYPYGISDKINNVPIVRVGQTATPLKLDYQDKKEFLINIPAFPGSSGSPIFIYNKSMYYQNKTIHMGNSRLYLVGVLYGGPEYNAMGNGKIITNQSPINIKTYTQLPLNLGFIIKSSELLVLKEELIEYLEK